MKARITDWAITIILGICFGLSFHFFGNGYYFLGGVFFGCGMSFLAPSFYNYFSLEFKNK